MAMHEKMYLFTKLTRGRVSADFPQLMLSPVSGDFQVTLVR